MNLKQTIKIMKVFVDRLRIRLRGFIPNQKKEFKACGELVFVNSGTNIFNKENVCLSSNIYIGPDCRIFGFGGIDIHHGAVIGERVTIFSSNHNYDNEDINMLPFDEQHNKNPVSLGEHCWIGSNSIILPGVHIGKYSVIAAGSVITKSTEDFSIYGGNPGRFIKYRKNKKLDHIKAAWPSLKGRSIYTIE